MFLGIALDCVGWSTSKNAKIFVDVGVFGSIPKLSEKHKCYDISLKCEDSDLYKISSDEDAKVHSCTTSCTGKAKLDNKHGYGGRFGFYKQVDKFYAVGLEGYYEWYNVEYQDNGYKFQCTHDDCAKDLTYKSSELDGDEVKPMDTDPVNKCSEVFYSRRFFYPSKVFTKSKRVQIGALVAVKMYTNTGGSYLKVMAGMGALKRKVPVAVKHKSCDCGLDHDNKCSNSSTAQHNYRIEEVSAKKGLTWGVSIGTKVSQNIFMGLDFMSQRNKNKENTETYVNNKFGFSLSMELGK